jgi:hypothetical protein
MHGKNVRIIFNYLQLFSTQMLGQYFNCGNMASSRSIYCFTNHTAIDLKRITRCIIVRDGDEQSCQYNDKGMG